MIITKHTFVESLDNKTNFNWATSAVLASISAIDRWTQPSIILVDAALCEDLDDFHFDEDSPDASYYYGVYLCVIGIFMTGIC